MKKHCWYHWTCLLPFIGLSMHWLESSVYFSAAPLMAFALPLWGYRILTLGLIIFPLGAHTGFGSWNHELDWKHYIHHSKFNWNYGSTPIWDHLMGTNYKQISNTRYLWYYYILKSDWIEFVVSKMSFKH